MTASIYPPAPSPRDEDGTTTTPQAPLFPGQHPASTLTPSPDRARSWMEVDLDALRRNAARLRTRAGVPIVAMVKADGYGVGAIAVAKALGMLTLEHPAEADAPWGLGIAAVAEGVTLRSAGIGGRIVCFTPVLQDDWPAMHAARITPTLHMAGDITAWCERFAAPWHLAVDTGINRAGVRWDDTAALRGVVAAHPPEGIFTHYHSAESDDASRIEQERRFAVALELLEWTHRCPDALLHADNSHGIIARAPSPYHLARPGLGLYGAPAAAPLSLEPVVHLRTRIVDMRDVPAGDTVSYGATYTAPSARRIATIGIGHGDGYRRSLSNIGQVLLHGARCPVVGVVAMDMCMIDVTDTRADLGDVVTVIGKDGGDCITVDEVAARAQLSPYEILVGLRLRVPRIYLGGRT